MCTVLHRQFHKSLDNFTENLAFLYSDYAFQIDTVWILVQAHDLSHISTAAIQTARGNNVERWHCSCEITQSELNLHDTRKRYFAKNADGDEA